MSNTATVRAVASTGGASNASDDIKARQSLELVIAMVGPVASGVSTTAEMLKGMLSSRYSYEAGDIIKVSSLINDDARLVGREPAADLPRNARIETLQSIGNLLRERHGADYLAKRAVAAINEIRTSGKGVERISDDAPPRAARVRRVRIIDSLKNDAELKLLRAVYKDMLIVVGVFAPDHVRTKRLQDDGVSVADVGAILDRDQGEVIPHGQKTRSVFGKRTSSSGTTATTTPGCATPCSASSTSSSTSASTPPRRRSERCTRRTRPRTAQHACRARSGPPSSTSRAT